VLIRHQEVLQIGGKLFGRQSVYQYKAGKCLLLQLCFCAFCITGAQSGEQHMSRHVEQRRENGI